MAPELAELFLYTALLQQLALEGGSCVNISENSPFLRVNEYLIFVRTASLFTAGRIGDCTSSTSCLLHGGDHVLLIGNLDRALSTGYKHRCYNQCALKCHSSELQMNVQSQ